MCVRLDTIPHRDRRKDGQTEVVNKDRDVSMLTLDKMTKFNI